MPSSLGGALDCWRVTQAPHREGCSVQNSGHSRGPRRTCCHQLPRPHAQRRLFVTVRGPRKLLGTGLTAPLLRSPHDTETRSLKHRVSVSPRRTSLSVSTAKGSRLSSQVGAASLRSLEGKKDPSPGRTLWPEGVSPPRGESSGLQRQCVFILWKTKLIWLCVFQCSLRNKGLPWWVFHFLFHF